MAPKAVIRRPAKASGSLITAAAVKIPEKKKEAKRWQVVDWRVYNHLAPRNASGVTLCLLEFQDNLFLDSRAMLSLWGYLFTPHSVRRAGLSNDFRHHRRDLAKIKNRGRGCVHRYMKATKLQLLAQEIDLRVTQYGNAVIANIDEIMAGQTDLPIY